MPTEKPELIAPAGDFAALQSALEAGADALYFGAEGCNMRAASRNFQAADFPEIRARCSRYGAKAYLALNTVIYDGELPMVEENVKKAKEAGLDAVICWDMAVVEACRREGIPFHLSTQASVANLPAVRYYAGLGASMIVPARELTLKQVREITEGIEAEKLPVRIECFVHGAMCVAVSGRCFLSQEIFGRSANRGECLQPCRRTYRIIDSEEGHEFELGESTVMSPKDLCAIEFIDRLMDAGIGAFKIEGRNRSPEYVATTTAAYRRAIDFAAEHRADEDFRPRWHELTALLKQELAAVYNRGFSEGFWFGRPMEAWARLYGSQATEKKTYLGIVNKYYPKAEVAEILLHARGLDVGEKIAIQGPATGNCTVIAQAFYANDRPADRAEKGDSMTLKCPRVRRGDKVYVLEKRC